jgi:hypothetical protein
VFFRREKATLTQSEARSRCSNRSTASLRSPQKQSVPIVPIVQNVLAVPSLRLRSKRFWLITSEGLSPFLVSGLELPRPTTSLYSLE